jgi:hypothetical protein
MANDKPDPELLTALTTEHFVLQSARGQYDQRGERSGRDLLGRTVQRLALPAATSLGVVAGLAAFIGQVVYERRQYLQNAV